MFFFFVFSYIKTGQPLIFELVEALRYKPEGRGFDSRWCHSEFSMTQPFRPQYDPRVYFASNRNEYREYFLGVNAVGA